VKKTLGLRSEILFTLIFLLFAALLLFGTLYLRFIEQELIQQKIDHLKTVTGFISSYSQVDRVLFEEEPLVGLEKFCQISECQSWKYYNSALDIVAASVSSESLPVSSLLRKRALLTNEIQIDVHFPSWLQFFLNPGHDQLSLAIPLKIAGRSTGVFEIIFSLTEIRDALSSSFKTLFLYIVGMIIVLIAVGYYLMQKNIIKPVRKFLMATKGIAQGNFSDRIIPEGPTEIFDLTTEFNVMAEALERNRAATADHIDALNAANRELKEARRELIASEKMATVGQLAAGFAHEIGNPLSALIGYLELLKPSLQKSSQSRDILQRALVESSRIDQLVHEVLNYARPEDRTLNESIDLVKEIQFCLDLLENQGRLKQMNVECAFAEALPLVRFNKTNFHQVIVNLLLNAVDACGKSGNIDVSGCCHDAAVCIRIRDNGEGIEKNNINKIFDPFFTTKPPGKGTGLGLAVCHRIMNDYGGSIEVTSTFGEGSLFLLYFPIMQEMCK
jgi:signal transduction histidine kinase